MSKLQFKREYVKNNNDFVNNFLIKQLQLKSKT